MKKIILFTGFSILLACSPKGTTKATATTPTTVSTEPTDVQLTAVKTKYPDATIDVLKKGHSIYYGGCTRCHGAKSITRRDEKEWVSVLDEMAPKAKLTPEDKDAVWKYIMSVKLSEVK